MKSRAKAGSSFTRKTRGRAFSELGRVYGAARPRFEITVVCLGAWAALSLSGTFG